MLTELFCEIDDFCNTLSKDSLKLLPDNTRVQRIRHGKMTLSEMMTIVTAFQLSNYKHFKAFYLEAVCKNMAKEFPKRLSYARFVRQMPKTLHALTLFLKTKMGNPTGVAFVDSTSINICHNRRIKRNKVFKGVAALSKSTMGWFYGFKLHLMINDQGEILSCHISRGNVDDRKPLKNMAANLFGKLFGDRGYISKKLKSELKEQGVDFITTVKGNMKNKLMPLWDKLMMRRRFLIETVNDQLKNQLCLEHTRHRSPSNFVVNVISCLVAYCFKKDKPHLKYRKNQTTLLPL